MSMQPGARLGPYEIVTRVGAGGMGEVFRARDTRLDRTVAVKTLPTELARNTQLRLRFQREARAISALSHPNICALYDVGEHDGIDYLVMEYLEGETLADRIARGPVPLKEALRIGVEIAAALERAHRDGVVHRDLKPGNVMLTKTGAKLLDFGLAKTAAAQPPVSGDAPTVQQKETPLTSEGTIVGTFQYMAPEQLEGANADARTDIFAFGAVLYEMITGTRAFAGRTRTSLIAAIVGGSPRPMSELVPVTPPELEHVVQRCLEKEPDVRWQSVQDVRLELEWIARRGDAAPAIEKKSGSVWPWVTAAAIALAAIATLFALRARRTQPAMPMRAHLIAPKAQLFGAMMNFLSISPDGRVVTFSTVDDDRLWVRPLDSLDARPLEGTKGGTFPFWSPDGRWIAFFQEGKLRKVTLSGAPPVTICDAPRGRSGSWNENDVILFAPTATTGIHRVSANGGQSQPVTKLDAKIESTHRWPVFLPDGKRFLYFAGTHKESVAGESAAIYLGSLDDPSMKKLVVRARSNGVLSKGHLLYVRDQFLVAQPFDEERGTTTGEPLRIAEGVEYDAEFFRGAFAASPDGMLVYRNLISPPNATLNWYEGSKLGAPVSEPLPFRLFTVSPDGKRVAASVVERNSGLPDLWVVDLETSKKVRLTATAGDGEEAPQWSPDGTQIVFSRHAGFTTGGDLYAIPADGSGRERLLVRDTEHETLPTAWSRNGDLLFERIEDRGGARRSDIMVASTTQPGAPRPVLDGPENESRARFSPDGRWVVYISDEGGDSHAYATSYPGKTAKVQISPRRAGLVRWIDDGIIAATHDGVFFIPVRTKGDRLEVGAERLIASPDPRAINGDLVSADRSLVAMLSLEPQEEAITVTTDWLSQTR